MRRHRRRHRRSAAARHAGRRPGRRRDHRRRRHLHLSAAVEVVGRLQQGHRHTRSTTSRSAPAAASPRSRPATVDFGSSDKPLPSRRTGGGRPRPVPVGDRRRGAGGQRRRHRRRQAAPDRRAAGRHLPRQGHDLERPGDRRAQPGRGAAVGKINVVHRSDGSGTTFNFVNYLSKVSPEWKAKVGEGTSVQWPAGIGGKGNEGVAAYVKQIKGSIGYVELAYALQNGMALRLAAERRRQLGAAERRELPGRGRHRRLGQRQGLQPGDHQCTGRRRVADHRDQFHPDVQAAEGRQALAPTRSRSSSGRWRTARRRRRRWTTCRCRRRWCSRSRRTGPASSSDASALAACTGTDVPSAESRHRRMTSWTPGLA